MKTSLCLGAAALLLSCTSFAREPAPAGSPPSPDDQYVPGPDSQRQPGVPAGKVYELTLDQSVIFPGTSRTITVYVPAQYTGARPACVYVGLDGIVFHGYGIDFDVPIVFDNLIHKGQMPITVAIGLAPGTVSSSGAPRNPRFNRSFEFDGLSDRLARFVLEEVFPEIERRGTPDGSPIRLSRNANDLAAGGVSTGGIGAFTLAWERPDAFRRVFTGIGTFVGMRGGDRYPVLVRKTAPKPLRIFMQDGSNDEWMMGPEVGDWWMANQTMARALEFAGYEVRHVWGEGSHNPKHAIAVFPDAMRWLWKDWPQPIAARESQNTFLQSILQSGEDWQILDGTYQAAGTLAVDPHGAIVFPDVRPGRRWKISPDGTLHPDDPVPKGYSAMAFGPDGRAYIADLDAGLIAERTADQTVSILARDIRASALVATHAGALYVTESESGADRSGKLWLMDPKGRRVQLDSGLNHPSGVALSPDGLWLAVAERKTHWGYSYGIRADGTVQHKQPFYWFHVPDTAEDSGAAGWVTDRDGRLYAATRMGVQVFDRNGRVRAILPVPGGEVTGVSFGGRSLDTLYVSCADGRVYRRKVRTVGALPWSAPIELPDWMAG